MQFTLKVKFTTTAEALYKAWLSSHGHSNMTGGEAHISDQSTASFTAWDGYISGKNLVLEPYRRIVQSWRTTEFKEEEADSQIELLFKELDGVTELTLIHTDVPENGEQYKTGWVEHYFEPMKVYFSKDK